MTPDAETRRSPAVAAALADLAGETAADRRHVARLGALLDRSRLDAAPPDGTGIVSPDPTGPLGGAAAPEYLAVRREAPADAAGATVLDDTVPAWARGAAVAETIGPLKGVDGREVWFDFYAVAQLVPVYRDGESDPVLFFALRRSRSRVERSIDEKLRLLRRPYDLGPSSVWIKADALATGAPAGGYVGLRIASGRITFVPPLADVGGRLTIPAGGSGTADLELAPPDAPAVTGGVVARAGRDAVDAELGLPATVSFTVAAGGVHVTALAGASRQLYRQAATFAWLSDQTPVYEELLESVRVPMSVSTPQVAPGTVESPFIGLTGSAPVAVAGWVLPVATIDPAHPTEADGAGGLAIRADEGLTLGWPGLRDGPVRLPSPWFVLWPGLVAVVDAAAANLYAHQRLWLWKDAGSRFRSELDLRYSDSFPLRYFARSSGVEELRVVSAVDARLDRPIDVRGDPLTVRTRGSQFTLRFTDARVVALVADDNIIEDTLDGASPWRAPTGHAISLAIHNALFTTTPVNALRVLAELSDEETAKQGTVVLDLGLYGLLPTLPDPYAAHTGRIDASRPLESLNRQVNELLVVAVEWATAAVEIDPDDQLDEVATRFSFAPGLGGPGTSAYAALPSAPLPSAPLPNAPSPYAASPGAAPGAASILSARRQSNEGNWEQRFGGFEQEQFALLDVSSNADQMGVSFAWFNSRALDEPDLAYYQVYGVKDAAPDPADGSGFPFAVQDLDLSAQSRFVRAFTTPQLSWEPILNLTEPALPGQDPPSGFDLFPDDGGPTRLFNDSVELVPVAPIPVMEFLTKDFHERDDGFTGALFTLPFGLHAFAEFSRRNQFTNSHDGAAEVAFNAPQYDDGDLVGGLQLRVDAPTNPPESAIFRGSTLQFDNLVGPDGTPTGTGTLGRTVGEIFNNEFFYDGATGYKNRGVPLTRIDFSGYGASIFSHWQNPNAVIAATSQAHFDVFVGRVAHEVVQVRSLVYPWGIRVVRTITMFRASSGYVYRYDSGWQAESDGVYDFRYNVYDASHNVVPVANPYTFHPGVVRGVFAVRNIRETPTVPPFTRAWVKHPGEQYLDDDGVQRVVDAGTPPNETNLTVDLQPVFFDADVEIEGVESGASGGRAPAKGVLGYVQRSPRGEPIPAGLFVDLLDSQFGAIGGPVDCVVDVAGSGQHMRIGRVDVSASRDTAGGTIFVAAARGAVTLPKDGSWSVVQHLEGTGEVTPLDPQASVPLIRRGRLDSATGTTDATANDLFRLANPAEIVQAPVAATRNFGLLQSTGTQKALFRQPSFRDGSDVLLGVSPDFADAYRMVNSAGIFPNVADAIPLALGTYRTQIIAEGYKLLDPAAPGEVFHQILQEGPLYLINEQFLKLYVEYQAKDKDNNKLSDGVLQLGLDSSANDVAQQWLANVNDIGMVVDLGPLTRLMLIRGSFAAEKGIAPAFAAPELVFSEALQPVINILQVLEELQGGDYAAAFKKGLDVAMSNGADSWNYAFHARKEIPVVKFPPEPEYGTSATDPLKLEAHLAVGVYFNEAMRVTTDPAQLMPSAGAFLEFGGTLSVMCVSLAAVTIYAHGEVDLITAADIKTGPALHMKFGFGAEIVVGLPVIGGVSLLYMVGVQIDLDTSQITVAGFLTYRGRAELLGGLVTVQIQIEAKGSVQRTFGADRTDLVAQVTFGLDISLFLVINISFSQSWQEARQIA